MQLIAGSFDLLVVRCVDHVHDGVDPATVSFPHGPEAWLTTDVPHLVQEDGERNGKDMSASAV